MKVDVGVVGRDPNFGGGGSTQTEKFLRGVRSLGRIPELWFAPHPGIRGPSFTWRRVEALRQLAWSRRTLEPSRSLWVVSTHASDGGPAARSGRVYDAWIGTTVETEHHARSIRMPRMHRFLASASIPTLRHLERDVLERARRIYATSAASRADIALASSRDDIRILPIPVDVERFAPAAAWPPAQPNLLFVGRADDPRKNAQLLLDTARRLPDVTVTFVGTPPRGPVPPNVRILGVVSDITNALASTTLFVLPSYQEGFGIAAAEALAAGIPVVTTPSGGPEELVRASGGGVVLDGFSAEELTEVVQRLLLDHQNLGRMRAAGRAYIEREHSYGRFRALLAQALA